MEAPSLMTLFLEELPDLPFKGACPDWTLDPINEPPQRTFSLVYTPQKEWTTSHFWI